MEVMVDGKKVEIDERDVYEDQPDNAVLALFWPLDSLERLLGDIDLAERYSLDQVVGLFNERAKNNMLELVKMIEQQFGPFMVKTAGFNNSTRLSAGTIVGVRAGGEEKKEVGA